MENFFICGGNKLNGEIEISTSKNAVLPILAACILTNKQIIIHKFPKYADTKYMLDILANLGAKWEYQQSSVVIDCSTINKHEIPI